MPDEPVQTEEEELTEEDLFGPSPDQVVVADGEPQEEAAVAQPEGEAETEEAEEPEEDESAEVYKRYREKALEAQAKAVQPQPETKQDGVNQIAAKALELLEKERERSKEAPTKETPDSVDDPNILGVLRDTFPQADEEEVSKMARMFVASKQHGASEVQEAIEPLKQKLDTIEQTAKQQGELQRMSSTFFGTLREASQDTAIHAHVIEDYARDMERAGRGEAPVSPLYKELEAIGLQNPSALQAVVSSPRALKRLIDGLVFEIEEGYGQLEDVEEATEEVSSSSSTRAPRRQQKRTKKPSEAEVEEELDRETFGEARPIASWEVMRSVGGT